MIELSFRDDFSRMEKALIDLAGRQLPFAAAQALNDCARAAATAVNAAMPSVFDRPTPFTDRAAIAPRALAATKDRLDATVTLRPIQAAYLRLEEEGGARSPADNTRKPASALVLPGAKLPLDQYGNIPAGTLKAFRDQPQRLRRAHALRAKQAKQAGKGHYIVPLPPVDQTDTVVFIKAGVKGNKANIGGYFRRLSGHHLARLTAFEPEAHYSARMGYHQRIEDVVRRTWPDALRARLTAAIATAR